MPTVFPLPTTVPGYKRLSGSASAVCSTGNRGSQTAILGLLSAFWHPVATRQNLLLAAAGAVQDAAGAVSVVFPACSHCPELEETCAEYHPTTAVGHRLLSASKFACSLRRPWFISLFSNTGDEHADFLLVVDVVRPNYIDQVFFFKMFHC